MSQITKGCHYITGDMRVNQSPLEHIASEFVPLSKTGDVESMFFAS